MEELLNMLILDELYQAQKVDFEDKIVEMEDKKGEYYRIIDNQERIITQLSEQILQHVKNSKIQEEILSKIPLMEKYFQEEQEYWNIKYYKLGVKDGMRIRDIKKQVWLNEEELKTLKQNAKKTGLNESSYIRNLIMGYKPKEQPTENMHEIIKQLKLVGINLNQIARKANTLNLVDAPFYKKVYIKWCILVKDIKKEFLDMGK